MLAFVKDWLINADFKTKPEDAAFFAVNPNG